MEMGRSSFNISSSVNLAAWGTGMHFQVPFLSPCYPVKTLQMAPETLNETMGSLEPHFCQVFEVQGEVISMG